MFIFAWLLTINAEKFQFQSAYEIGYSIISVLGCLLLAAMLTSGFFFAYMFVLDKTNMVTQEGVPRDLRRKFKICMETCDVYFYDGTSFRVSEKSPDVLM